jgi:hypothetical protein
VSEDQRRLRGAKVAIAAPAPSLVFYSPLVKRLDFEFDYDGGLTTARLISDFGRGVVEQHWPGLDEQQASSGSEAHDPFVQFAVNSNNQEEVAVYLGLAWALTAGTERYAIPTWSRDEVARRLSPADFDLVRWEYGIAPEEPLWPDRVRGFVRPANPLPLRPPPTDWQQEHHAEAGLFPVADLPGLTRLAVVTLSDVWGDLDIFGLARPSDHTRLIDSLRAAQPPAVRDLLGPGDVFTVVTVGVDLGFFDSVYAVGVGDRRAEWSDVVESFRRRVDAYEATVDSVLSVEQLFAALTWLQGGPGGRSAISYPNVHRAMIEHLPEARRMVEQHIADHAGHVRLQLLFGELARFALAAHRRGDADLAARCLCFLDSAIHAPDDRVAELVATSFIPAIAAVPAGRSFVASWPATLQAKVAG